MIKLSIITINYNNLQGLKKTIDSVKSQSFRDFEWILIDGGSSDGSKELIEENKDCFSYWVSEPDAGIYDAMNKGIILAKGEYCQFLNSGDFFIASTTLQDVFQRPLEADVNYGDVWLIKNDEIIERRTYPDVMTLSFLFRSPLGHQAVFVKTDLAKKYLYRTKYKISADRAFFMELYCNNCSFGHISQPVVFFDSEGIGSVDKTLMERRRQFYQIKREFFSDQVTKDIERLLSIEDEFLFVMRIKPLWWGYLFFKKLKKIRNRF